MKHIKTILYYDCLQIKRSASFWLITLFLLYLGVCALCYGFAQVSEQNEKIALDEVLNYCNLISN